MPAKPGFVLDRGKDVVAYFQCCAQYPYWLPNTPTGSAVAPCRTVPARLPSTVGLVKPVIGW
jgi:hypothetical protein